jgi:uncharacterized protein YbaP (TraB family)
MLRQFFRRACALVGLGIAALSAPAVADARPALWAVSDKDTTIYLFGTIHLLPKNASWRGAEFDQAVANSNDLVIETIIDPDDPTKLQQALFSLAVSPNLKPLRERVAPDKRAALDAAIKASGLPVQAYDRLETWAAAFLLLGQQFRGIGLESDEGVEMVLRRNFEAAGKKIEGLESNSEQLGFFDRLPEEAQVALIEGALSDNQDMKAEFGAMLDAWSSGDVDRIAKTFDKDLAESPALRDALMVQRNRNWTGWIERRMAEPGVTMVAVGAGHLAGKDSVLAMLSGQGYSIRRLQ